MPPASVDDVLVEQVELAEAATVRVLERLPAVLDDLRAAKARLEKVQQARASKTQDRPQKQKDEKDRPAQKAKHGDTQERTTRKPRRPQPV